MSDNRQVNRGQYERAIELMTEKYGPPEPYSVTDNGDGTVTVTERFPGTEFEIRRTQRNGEAA